MYEIFFLYSVFVMFFYIAKSFSNYLYFILYSRDTNWVINICIADSYSLSRTKFEVDALADFTVIKVFLFLIDVVLDKQIIHVLARSSRGT